jgi:hypothetical protein
MTEDVGGTDTPKGLHSVDTPGITSPPGELMAAEAFAAIDWDARLRNAVAATIAGRQRRRDERAAFALRRAQGLRTRYAAKNAHNRGPTSASDDVSNPRPTHPNRQVTATTPDGETGTRNGESQ